MTDHIVIRHEDLHTTEVDIAIETERRLRERELPPVEEISPLRRLLMSSMFYMPCAGALAALGAWLIIEPQFDDFATVGGEVLIVNESPFDIDYPGSVSLTVGSKEVILLPGETRLESGVDGQAPFRDPSEIEPGSILEAAGFGVDSNRMFALGVRPATEARARSTGQEIEADITLAAFLMFPLTAVMIAIALLVAEGISSRNWIRLVERVLPSALLTAIFSVLAYVPAGLLLTLQETILENTVEGFYTAKSVGAGNFIVIAAFRSMAWACIGAAMGLGMNLARSTRIELRNAVVGGALGGALGGVFFDPVDRFLTADTMFANAAASRLIGFVAVGLCVGIFVALVNRLASEAWLRVRTGPLAGKSFVLYRTPTTIGSSPHADIYLFKDAGIDGTHASVHRIGNRYEIEDTGSRSGITVNGRDVQRQRLVSGEQIVLGATVLEFEERAKRFMTDSVRPKR